MFTVQNSIWLNTIVIWLYKMLCCINSLLSLGYHCHMAVKLGPQEKLVAEGELTDAGNHNVMKSSPNADNCNNTLWHTLFVINFIYWYMQPVVWLLAVHVLGYMDMILCLLLPHLFITTTSRGCWATRNLILNLYI